MKFSDVFHSCHRPFEAGWDGFIPFFVTKEEKEICGNLLSAVLKIFMFQSCEKLKRRGKKKRERKLEWCSVEPNQCKAKQSSFILTHRSQPPKETPEHVFHQDPSDGDSDQSDKRLSFTTTCMNPWVLQSATCRNWLQTLLCMLHTKSSTTLLWWCWWFSCSFSQSNTPSHKH